MSYKILAVVKFNNGEALVLDEKPVIKYEKHGNYLFGLDEYGVFADSYYYDTPTPGFQAFAGREFNIPMTDGSFIKAKGQWWSGGQKAFSEALGVNLIHATCNTIDKLKKCYVFFGCLASEKEYSDLRNTYIGKVYEYYEYEKLINPERYGLEVSPCDSPK